MNPFIRSPYFRLMRLDKPTGIWLLFWPCAWAIALLRPTGIMPDFMLLLAFALGAVIMRAAGCIINDWWDKDFDAQVERTRDRPLASGEISVSQAFALLALLLIVAAGIAFYLSSEVALWAAAALPLVVIYPLMKRVTYWPQAFLGLTFNWGALLGAVAISGSPSATSFWLYAAGFFWTLGYDTIYAHQDAKYDSIAGIRSTALALHRHTKPAILLFYLICLTCFCIAGYHAEATMPFYGCVTTAGGHFALQLIRLNVNDSISCARIFRSNVTAGFILFAACLLR